MGESERIADPAENASEHRPGLVASVAICVAVVLLATTFVPLVTGGPAGSPAESLIPVFGAEASSEGPDGSTSSGSGTGFGALNVGDSQSVGGDLGIENPFRTLNTSVHFEVETDEPGYWRTGSFDEYTGGGWARTGPSDASSPRTDSAVTYNVELAQQARSLPSIWRPTSIDGVAAASISDGGMMRSSRAVEAGISYDARSRRPVRDPSVLARSDGAPPDELQARYTALPNATERALADVAANVTEGASTPYETATRIENWLEDTKEYSLSVSDPGGQDVAARFVNEMDAGYCEYFATAMVAMLRTQDVPARYVVGYSRGQRVDSDTYRVRAMNAHAWVEVYFADVGWVRFDPTPGSERLAREQRAIQGENASAQYDPLEEGSPGETFSPATGGEVTDPADGTPTTPTTPNGQDPGTPVTPTEPNESEPSTDPVYEDRFGPFDLAINRTAVPGATVTAAYVANASPVVDARVFLNGRYVGRTDANGTIVATLPYADSVNLTAVDGRVPDRTPTNGSVGDSGNATDLPGEEYAASQLTGHRTSEALVLRTDARIEIGGTPRTNETLDVSVLVEDVPVRNAVVRVEDTFAGRTDENGNASVTFPSSPGSVTISANRDPVVVQRRVTLPALDLQVETATAIPIGGTPVVVTARLDNEPAADVPVTVGGTVVGRTDEDGRLATTLPMQRSVPIEVRADGQVARSVVADPLRNLLGVAVAVVATMTGLLFRRRLLERAEDVGRAGRVIARRARRVTGDATPGVSAVRGAISRVVQTVRDVRHGRQSVSGLWVSILVGLASLPTRLRAIVSGVRRADPADSKPDRGADPTGDAGPTAIHDAWARLLGLVSMSAVETKTPGQIAAHAISADGLPAAPVATLRDEYRAVEYGPQSPAETEPRVRRAIAEIERSLGGDPDVGRDSLPGADNTPRSGRSSVETSRQMRRDRAAENGGEGDE